MIRLLSALALGFAMFCSTGIADAQTPTNTPSNNQPQNARPAVLRGHENLSNFGELTFIVRNNDVEMIDASRTPVKGQGSVVGNHVTITFSNCVYEGEFVNGVLAGTARFTTGSNAGKTWSFNVRYTGNL